jgi:hypothetical protein
MLHPVALQDHVAPVNGHHMATHPRPLHQQRDGNLVVVIVEVKVHAGLPAVSSTACPAPEADAWGVWPVPVR